MGGCFLLVSLQGRTFIEEPPDLKMHFYAKLTSESFSINIIHRNLRSCAMLFCPHTLHSEKLRTKWWTERSGCSVSGSTNEHIYSNLSRPNQWTVSLLTCTNNSSKPVVCVWSATGIFNMYDVCDCVVIQSTFSCSIVSCCKPPQLTLLIAILMLLGHGRQRTSRDHRTSVHGPVKSMSCQL